MKKRLVSFLFGLMIIIIVMFYVAGCAEKEGEEKYTEIIQQETITFALHWGDIERFVDKEAGVVCWVYTGNMSSRGSVSCLPITQTKLEK